VVVGVPRRPDDARELANDTRDAPREELEAGRECIRPHFRSAGFDSPGRDRVTNSLLPLSPKLRGEMVGVKQATPTSAMGHAWFPGFITGICPDSHNLGRETKAHNPESGASESAVHGVVLARPRSHRSPQPGAPLEVLDGDRMASTARSRLISCLATSESKSL